MNIITLTDDALIVEPKGLDKLWSFTKRLTFPLHNVRGATVDLGANSEPKGLRSPGLGIPGKTSGTFYRDGEKLFWNISNRTGTVVVELANESFNRLILTVREPRETVNAINNAMEHS